MQHTYGIPCDMTPLMHWAECATFQSSRTAATRLARATGPLVRHLRQVRLPIGPMGQTLFDRIGRDVVGQRAALADRVGRLIDREASSPGWGKNLLLDAQIRAHRLLVRPATAVAIMSLYRALNGLGLAIGSSSTQELQGEMPRGYLATMAPCQVRLGLREMARIEENLQHRLRLTAFYHAELPRYGFAPLAFRSATVCRC